MSRKPDYKVKALNKKTNNKGEIGAAWINDNGTISIVINPFIMLQGGEELLITLFPNS